MMEFDDVLTDIDALEAVVPADSGLDDPAAALPVDPGFATTETWTAELWWELEVVETEVAGSTIALPDPFDPATGFSVGAAVGGWVGRRRARRVAPPRGPAT
jgi:hypothetical protein